MSLGLMVGPTLDGCDQNTCLSNTLSLREFMGANYKLRCMTSSVQAS